VGNPTQPVSDLTPPGLSPQKAVFEWLFVDLNSYFASVEQERHPELRGKPVAVVPMLADTTCCIAASYEAKAFGVKTGTQVGEAKKMCPGLILLEGDHRLYTEYHHRIVKAVERAVPVDSVLSIDEMACRLIGRERELTNALFIAREVKLAIRAYAGESLRCSIGLAPNRFLAKIASDMEKPDGLIALPPDILDSALRTLKLRDLPGVGRRMERRLNLQGIQTMDQLMDLDRPAMGQLWGGVQGERMWHLLRGADLTEEQFFGGEVEHAKSVGHSHILAPELRTLDGAWGVAHKLLHKSAMRLRAAGLWSGRLTLYVRYVVPQNLAHSKHYSGIHQLGWSDWVRFAEAQTNASLIRALTELWLRRPNGSEYERPFQVGLVLDELVPDQRHNFNLFESHEEEERQGRLAKAMDRLNQRYGLSTVAPLAMLRTREAAPTRIAFTAIPELFEDTTPIPGTEEG